MSASRVPPILWLAFTLFIVYGGTIPFHFVADRAQVRDKLARLRLNPLVAADTGRRVSVPDVVQNVALFIPFGALAALALRPRGTGATIAIAAVTAAVLGASVEAIQLFEVDRTTSASDVWANVAGSVVGAAATRLGSEWARLSLLRLDALVVDATPFYPFMIAGIVLCIAAWQPFDFTLDVSTLAAKARSFRADPWYFTQSNEIGVDSIKYVLFGLTATLWLREIGVPRAAAVAASGAAAVAVAFEASQWIVASRMPTISDAAVHGAGAAAGIALSTRWPYRRSAPFWFGVLSVATALAASVQMLSPFAIGPMHRPLTWMPFANYYEHTSFQTVSHAIELMLIYFPVGFASGVSWRRRSDAWLYALVTTFAIAAPLEYLQGWVAGRYGDVTDIGMSLLGAVCGVWAGTAGWRRFRGLRPKRM